MADTQAHFKPPGTQKFRPCRCIERRWHGHQYRVAPLAYLLGYAVPLKKIQI